MKGSVSGREDCLTENLAPVAGQICWSLVYPHKALVWSQLFWDFSCPSHQCNKPWFYERNILQKTTSAIVLSLSISVDCSSIQKPGLCSVALLKLQVFPAVCSVYIGLTAQLHPFLCCTQSWCTFLERVWNCKWSLLRSPII